MDTLLTTKDYSYAINRLTELMNNNSLQQDEQQELSELLDVIDQYNGLEFLKVREN